MRPHVVCDKITVKATTPPYGWSSLLAFAVVRRTQPLTTLACILWSPTTRTACITDSPSGGQLGPRQMWRKQGLFSYFLFLSLLALVPCCVIVSLLGRVLINPTQSGSDDGHMSMYSLYTQ